MKRVLLIASGVAVALAVLFWPYTVGLFMMGRACRPMACRWSRASAKNPGRGKLSTPANPTPCS
ncbi:hypothetical protein H0I39_13160 [Ottowia beijingensis]|uniref:Uncharacterized protein n=1 Tax=Ottowia beijingensis TaxID=1207057 RepID=A0A853IYM1_9BURK|nr:hypothetical protein [Ottowia beijingensis]NZA02469.1 hypothetical protein [Ottowia beijingensis]